MKPPPPVLYSEPKNAFGGDLPRLLLLLGLLFYCVNCSSFSAGLSRETAESPGAVASVEAQAVLAELSQRNVLLKSFKGLGKIKVWQKGQLKIDERVAWVGSGRNKLSIVLMISGYPAVKMASDGKFFYYYEAGEGRPIFKKYPATEASLERIISIPIHTTDIVDLIAGRVPLREHNTAILEHQDTGQGYVLILKKRWWGVTEKIYLDENKTHIELIECYHRTGSLIYRARFDEMKMVNGYLVPFKLSISNGEDAVFQLDVHRYVTDVAVTASMFELKPPD